MVPLDSVPRRSSMHPWARGCWYTAAAVAAGVVFGIGGTLVQGRFGLNADVTMWLTDDVQPTASEVISDILGSHRMLGADEGVPWRREVWASVRIVAKLRNTQPTVDDTDATAGECS